MIGLHSYHLRMRLVMVAPLVVEVGTKPTQIASLTLWRDRAVQSSRVETDNFTQILCLTREIFIPQISWGLCDLMADNFQNRIMNLSCTPGLGSLGGKKAMINRLVWEATLRFCWWRWAWELGSTGTATLHTSWRTTWSRTGTRTGTLTVPSSSTSGESRQTAGLVGWALDPSFPSGVQHCPEGRPGVTNCTDWSSQVWVLSSPSSGWVLTDNIVIILTWPANYSGWIIMRCCVC